MNQFHKTGPTPEDRATAVLERLGYDWSAFTMAGFIAHVSTYLGRRIEVAGVAHLEHPFCLRTRKYDFIFHSTSKSRVEQAHDQLHELAHLLLDHVGAIHVENRDDMKAVLVRLGVRFRAVGQPVDPQEQEAELLVYRVQQYLNANRRLHQLMAVYEAGEFNRMPFSGSYLRDE